MPLLRLKLKCVKTRAAYLHGVQSKMTDDNCAEVRNDVHDLPSVYAGVVHGSRLHLRGKGVILFLYEYIGQTEFCVFCFFFAYSSEM